MYDENFVQIISNISSLISSNFLHLDFSKTYDFVHLLSQLRKVNSPLTHCTDVILLHVSLLHAS